MLLHGLNLELPAQPKPQITPAGKLADWFGFLVQIFLNRIPDFEALRNADRGE